MHVSQPILNQHVRVDNFDVAPSLDLSVCESLQYLVSICFSIHLVARQLRMRSSSSFPSVSSQSDRLFRRQKRAVDKILSARRLLPGNCLSVFECVPQEPLASILPLCEDKIAYFARTPPDQTLPCISRLAPSWQLCSGQMMYAVCGFIKAFSNEPLCRLISAEPNQWFVREIISASISTPCTVCWSGIWAGNQWEGKQ